jgi:hypothetical protein
MYGPVHRYRKNHHWIIQNGKYSLPTPIRLAVRTVRYRTHLLTSTIITVLWNRTLMIYRGSRSGTKSGTGSRPYEAQLFKKRCTKSYLFTARSSIVSRKLASNFYYIVFTFVFHLMLHPDPNPVQLTTKAKSCGSDSGSTTLIHLPFLCR